MINSNVCVSLQKEEVSGTHVNGYCADRFRPVLDAFIENFEADIELGASVAVEFQGHTVVDLWGGIANSVKKQLWQRDTIGVVFSNTKAATALCAHLLVDAALIDLDKYVSYYWPEFAQNGKREITVRMLLDHSAGLPALREILPDAAIYNWEEMTERLERERPFWEPGTCVGYHGLTFGWLVGEVVRRVSGLSLGRFFQEQIATPLQLDFWIGLPDTEEHRVADIVPVAQPRKPVNRFQTAIKYHPESISALYFKNTGGWRPLGFNSRAGHAAEIGAAGGISNARALARMYGALAADGEYREGRLIRPATLHAAVEISSATHQDLTLLIPMRYAAGFMRTIDNRARKFDSACFGRNAFGHVGAGGSLGFALPTHRVGFGYTMNRMGAGLLLDSRADRLVEALYRILRY